MGELKDKVSGTTKEAYGKVTGDRSKENEGKLEQFSGDVKGKGNDLKDAASDKVDDVRDKLHDEKDEHS
jgi:uncharacterized protein YjbJ (UPF0337 family)